jgi:O-antigen/teichoic acid export membrane protein
MIVAVFSIPELIHRLGRERFGVLALAWALIGYASFFDLGLGRALTQLVARKLGADEEREVPSIVWTSLLLMLLLGLTGAGLMLLASRSLVQRVLSVPPALQSETLRAFYILALSMPVIISTAGLRGLLEAHQRFDLINALRIPMGVFTFAGPLLVLPFSNRLVPVVAVLAVGRVMAWTLHLRFCLRVTPGLGDGMAWRRAAIAPLLSFGSWITVANLVNPLLLFSDRFLIGALLPVAMVGYYTAPFEAVTKLWMIPLSLTAPVFPACSALGLTRKKELQELYSRSLRFLLLTLAPVTLVLFFFATEILQAWLGPDFAAQSAGALRILAVGVFVNCFAHVPYCFLQGLGRPEATAKLFLAELVPYFTFSMWMIRHQGIAGAAAAWSVRASLEFLLFLGMAWRLCSLSPRLVEDKGTLRSLAALAMLGVAMMVTKTALHNSFLEVGLTLVWLAGFVLAVWIHVLDDSERASVVTLCGPVRSAVKNWSAA